MPQPFGKSYQSDKGARGAMWTPTPNAALLDRDTAIVNTGGHFLNVRPTVLFPNYTSFAGVSCSLDGTVTWFNSADHTKTFPAGQYNWGSTLFAALNGFDAQDNPDGTYTETLTLSLVDATGAALKTATGVASYTTGHTGVGAGSTHTLVTSQSIGYDASGIITTFNGAKCTQVKTGPAAWTATTGGVNIIYFPFTVFARAFRFSS